MLRDLNLKLKRSSKHLYNDPTKGTLVSHGLFEREILRNPNNLSKITPEVYDLLITLEGSRYRKPVYAQSFEFNFKDAFCAEGIEVDDSGYHLTSQTVNCGIVVANQPIEF